MGRGLKKKDLILILIILCVIGLTFLIRTYIGGSGANRAVIKVNGAIKRLRSMKGRIFSGSRMGKRIW